jgi:Coenzyme PQQ synthesis protein D (PqqD)
VVGTIWMRKDNWVGSQIEDAFVMLDFEGGEYVSLNATATDVWNALENPKTAADIVAGLTIQYDVSADQCVASVNKLLGDLEAKGLIQPAA